MKRVVIGMIVGGVLCAGGFAAAEVAGLLATRWVYHLGFVLGVISTNIAVLLVRDRRGAR